MAIFNNPYPILNNRRGNFNDIGAEFNCTLSKVEFQDDNYCLEIQAEILNEPVIEELINKNFVEFVVLVESKPFLRKVYKSNGKANCIYFEINYKDISSDFSIDLNPRLITTKGIVYNNTNADYPMNEYSFDLVSKQKVAEHEKITVVFDRAYRLFDSGPLISVNKLKGGKSPLYGTMDIRLDDNYNILVSLNKSNYQKFKKMNQISPRIMATTLGMPVLYHALSAIRDNPDEFKQLDWANFLDSKYDIFDGLESANDVLRLTDTILEAPLIKLYDFYINSEK